MTKLSKVQTLCLSRTSGTELEQASLGSQTLIMDELTERGNFQILGSLCCSETNFRNLLHYIVLLFPKTKAFQSSLKEIDQTR